MTYIIFMFEHWLHNFGLRVMRDKLSKKAYQELKILNTKICILYRFMQSKCLEINKKKELVIKNNHRTTLQKEQDKPENSIKATNKKYYSGT